MSSTQKEYLQLLADKFISFNIYQMKYFNHNLKERAIQKTGLSAAVINTDFRSLTNTGSN